MSSFTWLYFVYCTIHISLQYITKCGALIQSTQITPSTIATLTGITVTTGEGVNTTADEWIINVETQQGADLRISMDSTWGFHPLYTSSLQLHMDGYTPNHTYHNDGEILFVFSIDDTYFAEMISIDNKKISYKECPSSNRTLLSRNVSAMINSAKPDRFHRYCKNDINTASNNANHGIDYWNNIDTEFGISSYKDAANWPMYITITNDPILNTISYSWTDSDLQHNKVTSHYTYLHDISDKGIDIYVSGDSPDEDFSIYSIDMTYSYHTTSVPTTVFPTYEPTTVFPTIYPTAFPTYEPTTVYPTTDPSAPPTDRSAKSAQTKPTNTKPITKPKASTNIIETTSTRTPETDIITANATKLIMLLNVNESPQPESKKTSWFFNDVQAIIVGIFFIGWLSFSGFVYCIKRKPKRTEHSNSNLHVHVVVDQANASDEEDTMTVMPLKGHANEYISQSAMLLESDITADDDHDNDVTLHMQTALEGNFNTHIHSLLSSSNLPMLKWNDDPCVSDTEMSEMKDGTITTVTPYARNDDETSEKSILRKDFELTYNIIAYHSAKTGPTFGKVFDHSKGLHNLDVPRTKPTLTPTQLFKQNANH